MKNLVAIVFLSLVSVLLSGCAPDRPPPKRLFSPGDVVKFKTNSTTEMIVIRYWDNRVVCSWMDAEQEREEDTFYEAELTTVR